MSSTLQDRLLEADRQVEREGLVWQTLRRIAAEFDKLGAPYAVVGGIALFIPGPWVISSLFRHDLLDSLVIFAALVNLHHFILDGAVWKLREGRVAALLLGRTSPEVTPTSAARWIGGPTGAARLARWGMVAAMLGVAAADQAQYVLTLEPPDARRLDAGLSPLAPDIVVPPRPANVRHVFHLYMVEARDRDGLLRHLVERGVEAKVHYPIPLHLQPAARIFDYKRGDFPITERQAGRILTLPVHQHLTEEQVDYMIDTVRAYYRR
jgi:hypothetical protein